MPSREEEWPSRARSSLRIPTERSGRKYRRVRVGTRVDPDTHGGLSVRDFSSEARRLVRMTVLIEASRRLRSEDRRGDECVLVGRNKESRKRATRV